MERLYQFFFGGWKRWLIFGPLVAALTVALALFIQPVLVVGWRFMPVFVFGAACLTGLTFTRMSWKIKLASVAANALAFAGLISVAGALSIPLLSASLLAGLLMTRFAPAASIFAVPVLSWLVIANAVPAIGQYELARQISRETEELSEFPVTHDDRHLSRSTAYEYAVRANSDRTREVSRVHITWLPEGTPSQLGASGYDKRCVWQAPLKFNDEITANKVWNSFWGSVAGVVRIECGEMKMRADVKTGENAYFMFGGDSWVTDLLFKLRHPLSQRARTVYWQKPDGSWVMLVSSLTYKPTLTGAMVPVAGPVTEYGAYGSFKVYKLENAESLFAGATLFSPELARTYGEAYRKFRFGLIDYFWYGKGLLEISEDPAARDNYPHQNSQPHYQAFNGIGPQLVLPFEPEGDKAKSLSRVLFFDAISGKIRGYNKESSTTVNGPRTALQNLHEAAPSWDWGQYQKVEPLLIHTADDRWYYHVNIINKNHAPVGIIVVDAEQLHPHAFESAEDARYFIREGKRPSANKAANTPAEHP